MYKFKLNNIVILAIGLATISLCIFVFHGLRVLLAASLMIIGAMAIYYALKLVIKDKIESVFVLIALIVFLSFIAKPFQLLAISALIGAVFIILVTKRKQFKNLVFLDIAKFESLTSADKIVWFSLLIAILFLGMTTSEGFFAADQHHPIAELSIANSYSNSILNTPDLSFNGKTVKYHFLGTQIPLLFSNILKLPVLESEYFLIPLFFILISFILINSFFSKYPIIKVPILILFFLPLNSWSIFEYGNLAFPMLYTTCSYPLAFILMILGTYFLINRQKSYLVLTACMLVVVKVAFSLTLFGGALLFFLRKREFKNIFVVSLSFMAAFIVLYSLFLSGSHSYNIWVLFPTFIFSMFPMSLISNANFSMLTLSTIFIPIFLYIAVILTYFKNRDNDVLLGLSAISLSGILGITFLTEIIELNSWQFYLAAYFSTALVFWFVFKSFLSNKKGLSKNIIICLFYCFIIATIFFSPDALIFKNFARYSVHKITFLQDIYMKMRPDKSIPEPLYSKDLIDAYSWLKDNTGKNSVIFFGKHYELQDINAKKWEPSTTFIRSALSARHMYCENFRYKGIGMEKDYPLRFANSVYFYYIFVDNSNKSKALLDLFYKDNFGNEPAKPLSEHKELRRLVHYFRFGKEWSWLNMPKQIDFEIRQDLNKLDSLKGPQKTKWLKEFLEKAMIDYVVLENSDRPRDSLQTVTQEVYKNNSVEILKVKK